MLDRLFASMVVRHVLIGVVSWLSISTTAHGFALYLNTAPITPWVFAFSFQFVIVGALWNILSPWPEGETRDHMKEVALRSTSIVVYVMCVSASVLGSYMKLDEEGTQVSRTMERGDKIRADYSEHQAGSMRAATRVTSAVRKLKGRLDTMRQIEKDHGTLSGTGDGEGDMTAALDVLISEVATWNSIVNEHFTTIEAACVVNAECGDPPAPDALTCIADSIQACGSVLAQMPNLDDIRSASNAADALFADTKFAAKLASTPAAPELPGGEEPSLATNEAAATIRKESREVKLGRNVGSRVRQASTDLLSFDPSAWTSLVIACAIEGMVLILALYDRVHTHTRDRRKQDALLALVEAESLMFPDSKNPALDNEKTGPKTVTGA